MKDSLMNNFDGESAAIISANYMYVSDGEARLA